MGPSSAGAEPTVLLVGAGERFTPAFQAALGRHRVQVETAELGAVVDAVIVTAPDLVLLMGEAAKDGGASVLQRLAGLSQNFTVPVVVLYDDSELDAKLAAFRHGATAVLPRSASVDATAEQVAKLAREIPEQGTDSQGALGDATLEEFIGALSRQLRAGLVGSLTPDGDPAELKLTLGRGRPLTEFLDTFVRRVRRHVVRAEPLRYELGDGEQADGLSVQRPSVPAARPDIARLRVILADDDTPRADAVAQELRTRGVTVVVTDLEPSPTRFQTLRQADPTVFVIGEEHAHGAGYELLRRLRRDPRLRWAALLVVRWGDIWSEERGAPLLGRLESTLAGLAEAERALFARAAARAPFDTRLEATGPARCLRALEPSQRPLRVRVLNPRVELSVDLSDGLIVGAEGRTLEAEPRVLSGVHALAALLVLGSGRVHVEPVDQPAIANIMTPVEAALTMADAETPPLTPSIPASGTVSLPPPAAEPMPASLGPVGSVRPAPILAVASAPAATPPRPALREQPAAPRPHGPPLVPRESGARVPQGSAALPPTPTPPMPFGALPLPAVGAGGAVPPSSAPTPPPSFGAPPPPVAPGPPSSGAGVPSSARERNPPAMTLPTPLLGAEPAPPGPILPAPPPWRTRFAALAAWFARQDRKLHAKRISPGTAAVLVGLGALQGLLLVTLYAGARWLARPATTTERAPPAPAATISRASELPPKSPRAPEAHPQRPEPAPSMTAVAPAPHPTARLEGGEADGSGSEAPSCEALLSGDPPHPGYYPGAALQQMRAGRTAIVHGDLKRAQAALCRAAAWNPKGAEIALDLALVLLLDRDGAQAAVWARRAVELDPANAHAQDALGDALARTGSYAEARNALLAGAGIDATNASGVRALVGRAMRTADRALRHGDYATAERGFRRALVLEPRSSGAATGLSYALVQLGDVEPGIEWARRAVALAPRQAATRLALGDALAKAGDQKAAAEEWQEASLLDPGNREARKRLRAAGLPPN